MPTIYGLNIIIDPNMVIYVERRPHSAKAWDRRGTYHRRISKKWKKRFGVKTLPDPKYIVMQQRYLVCHPETYKVLLEAIQKEQEKSAHRQQPKMKVDPYYGLLYNPMSIMKVPFCP